MSEYFGAERAAGMGRYLERFAASFGVEGLAPRERIPNTRRALAAAERARDLGRLHPFRRAVMNAYGLRGLDVEDDAVLAACAGDAGISPEEALAATADPRYRARVDAMGEVALRDRVTGIPTFLIGRRRVVGCQPYDVLVEAAEAEGAARRRPRHPHGAGA